jgi:hypothetical protein
MKREDSHGKLPKRMKHKSSRVNDAVNLNNFLTSANIPLRSGMGGIPARVSSLDIGSPNGSVFDPNVVMAKTNQQPVTRIKKSNLSEKHLFVVKNAKLNVVVALDRCSKMQHFNDSGRKDVPVSSKIITDLSTFGLTPATTSSSTISKDGKMAATCLLLN